MDQNTGYWVIIGSFTQHTEGYRATKFMWSEATMALYGDSIQPVAGPFNTHIKAVSVASELNEMAGV